MGSEMDTFAARLASFDVVLKPEKRRSSGVKGPRFIAWPHSKPSPAEVQPMVENFDISSLTRTVFSWRKQASSTNPTKVTPITQHVSSAVAHWMDGRRKTIRLQSTSSTLRTVDGRLQWTFNRTAPTPQLSRIRLASASPKRAWQHLARHGPMMRNGAGSVNPKRYLCLCRTFI